MILPYVEVKKKKKLSQLLSCVRVRLNYTKSAFLACGIRVKCN